MDRIAEFAIKSREINFYWNCNNVYPESEELVSAHFLSHILSAFVKASATWLARARNLGNWSRRRSSCLLPVDAVISPRLFWFPFVPLNLSFSSYLQQHQKSQAPPLTVQLHRLCFARLAAEFLRGFSQFYLSRFRYIPYATVLLSLSIYLLNCCIHYHDMIV